MKIAGILVVLLIIIIGGVKMFSGDDEKPKAKAKKSKKIKSKMAKKTKPKTFTPAPKIAIPPKKIAIAPKIRAKVIKPKIKGNPFSKKKIAALPKKGGRVIVNPKLGKPNFPIPPKFNMDNEYNEKWEAMLEEYLEERGYGKKGSKVERLTQVIVARGGGGGQAALAEHVRITDSDGKTVDALVDSKTGTPVQFWNSSSGGEDGKAPASTESGTANMSDQEKEEYNEKLSARGQENDENESKGKSDLEDAQ